MGRIKHREVKDTGSKIAQESKPHNPKRQLSKYVKTEHTLSPRETERTEPSSPHVSLSETEVSKNITTANNTYLISMGCFFAASFSSVFLKSTSFLIGGGLCVLAGLTALGISMYNLSKVFPKGLGRVIGISALGLSELVSGFSSLLLGMVVSAPLTMSCSPFTEGDLATAIMMLGLGCASYYAGVKYIKYKLNKTKGN